MFASLHVQDVATLIGATAAAYGVVRGMPILANRVRLARERDGAIELAREARDAAEAYRISSDGWQSAVERLREQIKELTDEVHTLRAQLAAAVLYITEVQTYMRSGGAVPKLPDALWQSFSALANSEKEGQHDGGD